MAPDHLSNLTSGEEVLAQAGLELRGVDEHAEALRKVAVRHGDADPVMVERVTQKGDTLSLVEAAGTGQVRYAPHLFLELECDRPLVGPARWRLAGLDQVKLGRGVSRHSYATGPLLHIQIPDGRMSLEHVELRQAQNRWIARDLGSKNRMFLDGIRSDEAELSDGALLQLGHTFFRFRADVPAVGPATVDFGLAAGVEPLSTLSAAFGAVLERVAAIAPARVPVLLVGESGTGKEVLARHLHALSGRRGALVPVNTGAISPNLVEAELFGHKKGAFSGATQDRVGWVRASDGGTLFLDEIGDLPLSAQAALLRVLQEAEVVPVGGHRPESLDLRVVAATHRDLKSMVREGRFRHDLLARLEGVTLELPPLRDRSEDIPLLLMLLLRKLAPERPDVKLTPAAARALLSHDWPLNIRELEQALAGALALSGSGAIDVPHLPEAVVDTGEREPSRPLTPEEGKHRDELVALLREHDGNLSAVARVLGKGRTQIGRWVSRYGIDIRSLKS
jgi:sigma-54 dependent transcriptional regulator, acetoin dehydrogenase operon transcriptional activator AcoR